MARAPRVTGEQLLRALLKNGFDLDRIRGSHHVLKKGPLTVVVPLHGNRIIGHGLLANILEGAEMTADDLQDLL